MMMKAIKALALVMLLGLGGCPALSALSGAIGSMGTAYLGDAVGEDIREAAVWRSNYNGLVRDITLAYGRACEKALDEVPAKIPAVCTAALDFSMDNQPRILLERIADRHRRFKAGRQSAPTAEAP